MNINNGSENLSFNSDSVVKHLKEHIPKLLAIYAFGSRVTGEFRDDSDLDLAVLVAGYADSWLLFETAQALANDLNFDVDLLDIRAASTAMQHQVFTQGLRLWALDMQADLFELAMLKEKFYFDEQRQALLTEIKERGYIYEQ